MMVEYHTGWGSITIFFQEYYYIPTHGAVEDGCSSAADGATNSARRWCSLVGASTTIEGSHQEIKSTYVLGARRYD